MATQSKRSKGESRIALGASQGEGDEPTPTLDPSERPATVFGRLLWVMSQLHGVDKTGDPDKLGYAFVEEPYLMSKVRPLFVQAGVYMAVNEVGCEQVTRTTREGERNDITKKTVEYTFVNVDDPEDRWTQRVHAYGWDNLDKGPGKALTAAGKMAVLKALMLPTGEDIEVPTPEAPPTEPEQRKQEPARQQRQQPRQNGRSAPQQQRQAPAEQPRSETRRVATPAPVTLETMAKARELAEDILLPPSMRTSAIEYLDHAKAEDSVLRLIARMEAAIDGAGMEGEGDINDNQGSEG